MEKAEFNYHEDLKIDTSNLDKEWVNQAPLFMKYSEAAAKARDVRDRAKERLDVARAEADSDIRKYPAKYGLSVDKKPTEGAILSCVIADSKVSKLQDDYLTAQYEESLLSSAVRAFDQRKSALEGLVRLFGLNYWSRPNTPVEASDSQKESFREETKESTKAEARGRVMGRRTPTV